MSTFDGQSEAVIELKKDFDRMRGGNPYLLDSINEPSSRTLHAIQRGKHINSYDRETGETVVMRAMRLACERAISIHADELSAGSGDLKKSAHNFVCIVERLIGKDVDLDVRDDKGGTFWDYLDRYPGDKSIIISALESYAERKHKSYGRWLKLDQPA